jgi:hypothetical protein
MDVLVTGGTHPNEMYAKKIWEALKLENRMKNVKYQLVPYEKTMHCGLNDFLKKLMRQGELESRFDGEQRTLIEGMLGNIREDLRYHNGDRDAAWSAALEFNRRFGDIAEKLPELDNLMGCYDPADSYLDGALIESGCEVGIDLHNKCLGERGPLVFQAPKKARAVNERLRELGYVNGRTLIENPLVNPGYYIFEIPAEFRTNGWESRTITKGFADGLYHAEFHDWKLPGNMKNFEGDKAAVGDIIGEIASFDG